MRNNGIGLTIAGLVLLAAGFCVISCLVENGWIIAVGVYLMLWANNIGERT